jgi:hypothetical protein
MVDHRKTGGGPEEGADSIQESIQSLLTTGSRARDEMIRYHLPDILPYTGLSEDGEEN